MDFVTIYLYGSSNLDNFMKILKAFKAPEVYKDSRKTCSIKIQKSLYGLKQSGSVWYNHLSEYFLKKVYKNDLICPFIFIKWLKSEFVVIVVYVDDLNINGTHTVECLKRGFEMKDHGKTKLCLGLQIENLTNGILVHQSTYT